VVSFKETDVSKVRTAFVIRAFIALMMEADAPLKRRSGSTKLHGASSRKAVIFKLVAVRT
jgi:hypothetical protein